MSTRIGSPFTFHVLAAAVSIAAFFALGCQPQAPRPNIVLVLLDDLGYEDLGSYGSPHIRTETIDEIAREGMRFTRFYTNGTACSPTRASILTGLFPSRLGIKRPFHPPSQRRIPGDLPLLPRALAEAGYVTAHVGKWHLGRRPDAVPLALGFDHSVLRVQGGYYEDFDYRIDGGPPVSYRNGEHSTTVLTDQALAFIDRYRDRPFFLNLWLFAPHTPFQVPREFDNSVARYDLSTPAGQYAAMVTDADRQIRRVVDRLAELGLDNTLIVVTSDNGPIAITAPASGGSLRGFKGSGFEGAIRVPMIVRWPGVVPAGTENDSLVASFDFFPTFAEVAGAEIGGEIDGRSFARILATGERIEREQTLFWENKISNEYFASPTDTLEIFAVRRGDWKLVADEDGGLQLFDLGEDPAETRDLSRLHPAKLEELRAAYASWRLQAPRISVPVSLSREGVRRDGEALLFEGGRAELGKDARLDFHDGDFTFVTRFQPQGPNRDQTLAQRGQSWRLALTARGAVELTVHGRRDRQAVLSSAPGAAAPEDEHHVAFTVFGWNHGPTSIRLYLDGELVAEAPETIQDVRPVEAAIVLGNDADSGTPFLGRIELPYLWSSCLSKAEIRRMSLQRGETARRTGGDV